MSGPFGSDQWMYSSGGYEIDQSLRFNDDDSAYLTRTPASAGNQRTWTWSGWVKRGNIGITNVIFQQRDDYNNSPQFNLQFKSDDTIRIIEQSGGANVGLYDTTAVFRDVSSWYHIVVAFDTTDSTEADRVKLYVNGTRITSFNSPDHWPLNYDSAVNTTVRALIGAQRPNASSTLNNYLDCYLADVHFIDGQALDPSYFGETDADYGHWKPIKYTGTYGTNGFYLDFGNSSSLGEDQSGNSNDWTANNLAATDVVLDSPTNNFATLNPIWEGSSVQGALSEGNLKCVSNENSTFSITGGKWYWEVNVSNTTGYTGIGFTNGPYTQYLRWAAAYGSWINGSAGTLNVGNQTAISNGVVMIAFDADNNKAWFGVDGTWFGSGDPSAGSNSTIDLVDSSTGKWVPESNHQAGDSAVYNFGQDSSFAGNKTAQGNTDANGIGDFYYAPPSGYLALCTQNLPEPTVAPADHFNTVLYTGTGTTQSITGVGFQPDWVWIKSRSDVDNNIVQDAVRGVTRQLFTNLTDAETNYTNGVTSFDSDGFTVATSNWSNENGQTRVAWNWKANGTGVSNTDGTITSTVSANVDAGFSIVSYTGTGSNATVGHGLSQTPDLVIIKSRSGAFSWIVQDTFSGSLGYLTLQTSDAKSTTYNSIFFNNTLATSSVIHLGSDQTTNLNSMIAYCFHSVDSFSKVGSYTGNGSTDGPFVYTGFRPAFVLVKSTQSTNQWYIYDTKRDSYNPEQSLLIPNSSGAEFAWQHVDFLSNGFKIKSGNWDWNYPGKILFLAFAENPFKYANAR